jgi:PAS domain S-box-containing protein
MHLGHSRHFIPYLVAAGAAAVAVGLRWLLDPWLHDQVPLVTLFAAVAFAVWYGGAGPALVTAALGYCGCLYLFIEPRHTIALHSREVYIGLAAYAVSVAIIIAFGQALRTAQQAARKRQELLQLTLASIGDAVIATDAAGRIDFFNSVAEQLTGWPQAEALGQPLATVFRIVNEATRQPVANPAERALAEGTVVGLANHTILIARDGSERPIDDSAAPIRDEHGQIVGAVLVFRDITQRRRS